MLVVEDEESFSDALSYMLRREGFDAVVASTGPEALAGVRPVTVNGEVGMLVPSAPPIVGVLTVADGRAVGVHVVMTPEKLRS